MSHIIKSLKDSSVEMVRLIGYKIVTLYAAWAKATIVLEK